jgi:hypothetical protein
MKSRLFASTVAALAFTATQASAITATITPALGPPSKSVTLKGTGFDASALVDVYFDTSDIALTVSNGAGVVNVTVPIPDSASPGPHWITLGERRTSGGAQVAYTVTVDWPQSGWGPSKRSFNPYENTITTANVSHLTRAWSAPLDGFGNSKPIVIFRNNIYVRDADQVIRAFSPDGELLWTATTPFSSFPDSLTPVVSLLGLVIFSDLNGNVIAYKHNCHANGATCAPSWSKNIGSAVAGGLTLRGSLVYAPAADGSIHVLNAATGAVQPTITVFGAGALTTWIAFGADGTGYVAQGTSMATTPNNVGSSSDDAYSGTLSAPAVGAHTAFVTETDNLLREVQLGWTTATGGSGCSLRTAPVFANGVVYAAGCTSLGAYDAGNGSALWTVTTPGASAGLAYANGVLFGCINNRVVAYAASYGGRLWTGGFCSAAPVIANGVLYTSYTDLSAYTLTGAQNSSLAVARPDISSLKPSTQRQVIPYGGVKQGIKAEDD